MSQMIRYTALVRVEVEIPADTVAIAGETRAVADWLEAADAVTVLGILERTCADCGSSVPGRCECEDLLSDDEDARELDYAQKARDAA